MEGNEQEKKAKKDMKVNFLVVKEFSQKQFGPFKGGHFFIIGIVIIVLAFLLVVNKNNAGNGEYPEYSMVYQNADGELLVTNKSQKEGIKISSDSETRDVVYANKTNRYILFEKNNALYLYNSKKKDIITLTDAMSLMVPYAIAFSILWLLIILCFYIVGLPLGFNTGVML